MCRVEETSAQLKEAAPKQLVTIGYEGFFGTGSPHASANPAGDWPLQTGHDFERNFATKTLVSR
jgi:hypothetical protein